MFEETVLARRRLPKKMVNNRASSWDYTELCNCGQQLVSRIPSNSGNGAHCYPRGLQHSKPRCLISYPKLPSGRWSKCGIPVWLFFDNSFNFLELRNRCTALNLLFLRRRIELFYPGRRWRQRREQYWFYANNKTMPLHQPDCAQNKNNKRYEYCLTLSKSTGAAGFDPVC